MRDKIKNIERLAEIIDSVEKDGKEYIIKRERGNLVVLENHKKVVIKAPFKEIEEE